MQPSTAYKQEYHMVQIDKTLLIVRSIYPVYLKPGQNKGIFMVWCWIFDKANVKIHLFWLMAMDHLLCAMGKAM